MWAWSFFIYSTNMFFRVVFVTCLLALVSANPLGNGFEPRIVGGRDAKKNEFPHQVSLQYSNILQHRCGGTILSAIWVVTAAHCVDGDRPKIVIKAGKLNITATEATEQIVEVKRIFIHEHFVKLEQNDIAMIKLVKPLNFNAYVNKIDLPVKGSEPTGTAILSGWGSISRTLQPSYPQILQTVTLKLLDAKTCAKVFEEITRIPGSIDPNDVCTAAGNAGQSACLADSGSPLIQSNKLVGIVAAAFIHPCGTARPTIYTKVSSFVDWVNDKMKNH